MPLPRATSDNTDELAATISALKSRLNELESVSGVGSVPVGTITDFIGVLAPSGWVLLDGATITNGQNIYPGLWAILPASFKSGADIVLPDTRGRVTVHRGSTVLNPSTTLDVAIGTTGGDESVVLTVGQLAQHGHNMEHDHTVAGSDLVQEGTGATLSLRIDGATKRSSTARVTGTSTVRTTTGNAGSNQGHNNLQPYIIVVKIMKLG